MQLHQAGSRRPSGLAVPSAKREWECCHTKLEDWRHDVQIKSYKHDFFKFDSRELVLQRQLCDDQLERDFDDILECGDVEFDNRQRSE